MHSTHSLSTTPSLDLAHVSAPWTISHDDEEDATVNCLDRLGISATIINLQINYWGISPTKWVYKSKKLKELQHILDYWFKT